MPRRARYDQSALDALAARQHNCLSLEQLQSVGVAASTVAHRTRPVGGTWQRLLPGTVLLHRGTPTPAELIAAAGLYTGAGAVLTGLTSLRLQGLRRVPVTSKVHVLVPEPRRRTSTGYVVCERSERMPTPIMVGGAPCAPIPRALVDASRHVEDLSSVRALTAEAVQRRLAAGSALLGEIREGQRRRTARIRLVGEEIVGGIRSAAEAEVRQFLTSSGFPHALWNHDLLTPQGHFIGCPDAWFDEAGVALEVDSREWHLDPTGWERTQQKRARFARFGVPTIPVTPRRLRHERESLATDIWGALRQAATSPRPDVLAVMRSQAA